MSFIVLLLLLLVVVVHHHHHLLDLVLLLLTIRRHVQHLYCSRWGPTSAARAGRAGWEDDDDDDDADEKGQGDGEGSVGGGVEKSGWKHWYMRRETSNNVLLL